MTLFQVHDTFDGWTWLECRPLTGRAHELGAVSGACRWPGVADAP